MIPPIEVRDSVDADVPAIERIYAHWVRHGLASFELEPPDVVQMAERRAATLAGGFPYLVAVDAAGVVLGYAYAGPYRTRPAYRFACEDSVYVAPGATSSGAGRALLSALIGHCEARGLRLMVAVIGDSGNTPSIGLHISFGFQHAGLLPATGWKHNRWVDTILMVRALGLGSASPPVEPPCMTLDVLDHDEVIAERLTAAVKDESPTQFMKELLSLTKARHVAQVAEASGLRRESIYRALAPGAHPRFETIRAVLRALSLDFRITKVHLHIIKKPPLVPVPARRAAKKLKEDATKKIGRKRKAARM